MSHLGAKEACCLPANPVSLVGTAPEGVDLLALEGWSTCGPAKPGAKAESHGTSCRNCGCQEDVDGIPTGPPNSKFQQAGVPRFGRWFLPGETGPMSLPRGPFQSCDQCVFLILSLNRWLPFMGSSSGSVSLGCQVFYPLERSPGS